MSLPDIIATSGRVAQKATGSAADKFYFFTFVVFMLSVAIEGPLRMALTALHVPFAIYLRDALASMVVVHFCCANLKRNFLFIVLFCLMLIVHSLVGYWMLSRLPQVIFGDKLLLYALYGACIGGLICRHDRRMMLFLGFLLLATMLGLIFNYFVNPPPWATVSTEVAGVTVDATRIDYAGGVARLTGFSRANTTAAGLVVMLSITFLVRLRSIIAQLLLVAAGLPFIFLTNSKATILCYLAATLPYICFPRHRAAIMKPLCILWIATFVLTPIALWGTTLHAPTANTFSLFSFVDRVNRSWPDTWSLIIDRGSVWLGRGIGGVGSPQKGYEPAHFVAVDNFFLYLFGNFGLFAIAYILCAVFLILRADLFRNAAAQFAVTIIAFVALSGVTGIVVEDQAMLCYLFAALTILYQSHFRPTALEAYV